MCYGRDPEETPNQQAPLSACDMGGDECEEAEAEEPNED